MRGITNKFSKPFQSPVAIFSADIKTAHNKTQENINGFTNAICQHFTPTNYLSGSHYDNYKSGLGEGLREMPSLKQVKDFLGGERNAKMSFAFQVNDATGEPHPASVTLKRTTLPDEYLLSVILGGSGTTNTCIRFDPDNVKEGLRALLNDILPINQQHKYADRRCKMNDKWLEGIILTGVCMREVDMSKSRMEHSILDRSNFNRAIMVGTVLFHAQLRSCILCYADLTDADLRYANLAGADLRGARLKGVCLTGARLVDWENKLHAHLDRDSLLDIIEAIKKGQASPDILQGVILSGADLSDLNLDNVDLRYTVLAEVSLRNTSFHGTKLNQARLDEVATKTILKALLAGHADTNIFCGCIMSNINLRDVNFSGILLYQCNFSLSHLENALFIGANLTESILNGTYLDAAKLDRAIMTNAQCQYSSLNLVSMKNAFVHGVNFKGSIFNKSILLGTPFLNNILTGTCFEHSTLSQGIEFYLMGAINRGEASIDIFKGIERHLIENIIKPSETQDIVPASPEPEDITRINNTQHVMNAYQKYLSLPCLSAIVNNSAIFTRPHSEDLYLDDDKPNVLISSQNTDVIMVCTAAAFRKISAAESPDVFNDVKWYVKSQRDNYLEMRGGRRIEMLQIHSPYLYSLYNSALQNKVKH